MTKQWNQQRKGAGRLRRRRRFAFALVVVLAIVLTPIGLGVFGTNAAKAATPPLTMWVLPQSGTGFLDSAVLHASKSIDLSMYVLSDQAFEADLVARAKAGLFVRVVLNSAYDGRSENSSAASYLKQGGVHVVFAPSSQIFHAKYLIIDNKVLYVGTGNLESYYYSSTRDFWVEDRSASDVQAALSTFGADFSGSSAPLADGASLLWSPGSTSTLVNLIGDAKHSLLVENEEMNDTSIESALEGAASRGVDVQVVMTYSSEWRTALENLRSAGVHVRVLPSSGLYIHAKVICTDCASSDARVFIGSENFSVSSLVYNRELGVLSNFPSVVHDVRSGVLSDYAMGSSNF